MMNEEDLDYRQSCPYDAMGDFSVVENLNKKSQSATEDEKAQSKS